jgi:glycosyltransferase involved in cell wall biosynthesis
MRSSWLDVAVTPEPRGPETGLPGWGGVTAPRPLGRPRVHGKFFAVGDRKHYLRGVAYGTFAPDADGHQCGSPAEVRRDFAAMAANAINLVRTYTAPPRWLLDLALEHGLQVMVGLPWEQHVTFLDDRRRTASIVAGLRAKVRGLAAHPALFAFAVGNEIPAGIVRWHGKSRVERLIERLCDEVKRADPEGLVTYVNYPTTEYLELPFLDFVAFNVYLESPRSFEAYLARLQNLAGDRPLVLAEIGLDSRRHGPSRQADTLEWQVRSSFAGGCAGTCVFSWTDQWHRGGADVADWDFGLTTRSRQPKPALEAVGRVYREVPFGSQGAWPRISVVLCSYNGARTIGETLEHLSRLEYPDFEVVVVDDGSTDDTAAIASRFDVRLIRIANGGLSAARNVGLQAASGEIVAYTDDDAYPDPHHLHYLAHAFREGYAAVGGPNLPPPGDGTVAEAVAHAPGGPVHVLIDDTLAEHIPGCNFAVRREWLLRIGGFDPQFRTAGDDVDACWRLQAAGGRIGFHPAALVWHHRRNSVWRYLKQQRGYGRAEALLARKWPHKYNDFGHLRWAGQLYGPGILRALRLRPGRIYHGRWGSAPFQSLYAPAPSLLAAFVQMPEWYLMTALLLALALGGWWYRPLLLALPLGLLAAGAVIVQALVSARRAATAVRPSRASRRRLQVLTAVLALLQPLARLGGRIECGLTPWRRSRRAGWAVTAREALWSERWRETCDWLDSVSANLRALGADYLPGREFDAWDLRVGGGPFGGASLSMVIEEHGGGKQMVRFRLRPHVSAVALGLLAATALAAVVAPVATGFGLLIAWWTYRQIGAAVEQGRRAVRSCGGQVRQTG